MSYQTIAECLHLEAQCWQMLSYGYNFNFPVAFFEPEPKQYGYKVFRGATVLKIPSKYLSAARWSLTLKKELNHALSERFKADAADLHNIQYIRLSSQHPVITRLLMPVEHQTDQGLDLEIKMLVYTTEGHPYKTFSCQDCLVSSEESVSYTVRQLEETRVRLGQALSQSCVLKIMQDRETALQILRSHSGLVHTLKL